MIPCHDGTSKDHHILETGKSVLQATAEEHVRPYPIIGLITIYVYL